MQSPQRMKQPSKISTLEVQLVTGQEKYQNVNKLIAVCLCLGLASFYFGFCLAYLSNVTNATMSQYFGSSAGKQSVIGGLIGGLPVGAAFGALCAPIFMRYFSRKNFLLLFNALAIFIAGIIQINNIILLFVCRIIQGFLVGNFMAITPIYINELAPVQIQGSFGAVTQLMVIVGVVLAYLLGVIFAVTQANTEFVWRFLFSFTGVTAILQSALLMFNFIPESPVSLVEKGDLGEARAVIAMFNTPDVVDKVLAQTVAKVAHKSGPPQLDETDMGVTEAKEDQKAKVQKAPVSLVSIKALLLGFELPFMQQLSGTNMIVTEIGSIVETYDKNLALYAPLLANIIQLIATAGSIVLLTHFGRRSLILFGNLSLAIIDLIIGAMFLILVFSDSKAPVYVALVFIMIFMISYGLTIGPVVWLYVPEIIPARFVPPATFMNWFGCSICVIVTPFVVEAVNSSYPMFFFFGGISLIFFVVNYFWVIETKGLTLLEIAQKMAQ